MQTKNILKRLPVVIIITIMIICLAGIIVAFNSHKISKTNNVKVTGNTNNAQQDTVDGNSSIAGINSSGGNLNPTVQERTTVHTTHQYSKDFVPGSKFAQDDSANGKTRYVIDSTRIDADGDGTADDVLLIGESDETGDQFGYETRNLAVVIRDGVTGKFATASMPEDFGNEWPKFSIGSFTAAKKNEILVSVETGGSGGIVLYNLMAYQNKKVVAVVPREELNKGLDLKAVCLPGFEMKITDKKTGYISTIELHDHDAISMYIDSGVYNQAGVFLKNQSFVDSEVMNDVYISLEPVDDDGDGIQELHGMQNIWFITHPNRVAQAESVWSVKGGRLRLVSEKIDSYNPYP